MSCLECLPEHIMVHGMLGVTASVYVGAAASPPSHGEPIWLVTDGGPFSSGSMRVSFDGGTTYKETGIVFT